MYQLKQNAQIVVNISAKFLPFIIQIALIALTILWLNQGLASAHFAEPDNGSVLCDEADYAKIVAPATGEDPCAEEVDEVLKFAEPDESIEECEDGPQLVHFVEPGVADEPCADEAEQLAKFVEPGPSDSECVEYSVELALIHFEFPNDFGPDCDEAESASVNRSA